jgi:hypothetical protein
MGIYNYSGALPKIKLQNFISRFLLLIIIKSKRLILWW